MVVVLDLAVELVALVGGIRAVVVVAITQALEMVVLVEAVALLMQVIIKKPILLGLGQDMAWCKFVPMHLVLT